MFSKKSPLSNTRLVITAFFIAASSLVCAGSSNAQGQSGFPAAPKGVNPSAIGDQAKPVAHDPESANGPVRNDASHQGVTMHGHWVIDVRNPDGTLAEHRDFENSITGFGQELLAGLVSGFVVPSDYAIFLSPVNNSTAAPCSALSPNLPSCGIVRSLTTLPGSALCTAYTCFTGLTYTANLVDSSGNGSSFTLAGNFTASQAGSISSVQTLYGTCPANIGGQTTLASVTPAACSTQAGSGGYRTLSYATITTVNVVASQIVQVTVTITFS